MRSFSIVAIALVAASLVSAAPSPKKDKSTKPGNTTGGTTTTVTCDDYVVAFCCPNGNIQDGGATVSGCATEIYMGGEFYTELQCANSGAGGSNTGICCSQAMVSETTYPNAIGSGTSCVYA